MEEMEGTLMSAVPKQEIDPSLGHGLGIDSHPGIGVVVEGLDQDLGPNIDLGVDQGVEVEPGPGVGSQPDLGGNLGVGLGLEIGKEVELGVDLGIGLGVDMEVEPGLRVGLSGGIGPGVAPDLDIGLGCGEGNRTGLGIGLGHEVDVGIGLRSPASGPLRAATSTPPEPPPMGAPTGLSLRDLPPLEEPKTHEHGHSLPRVALAETQK